jgi:hypothetical protein
VTDLLSDFVWSGLWLPLVVAAAPLGAIGLWLRVRGRAALGDAREAIAAKRALRDLTPGRVTLVGGWSPCAGGALLTDDEGRAAKVLVEPAPAITPGTPVLVVGDATHEEAAPRAVRGYRDGGRVWVVTASGPGALITTDVAHLDGALRRARRRARAGAALFASAVAAAAFGVLVAVAA